MSLGNRKTGKMRGSRTCGGGSHKKHRGAGHRGGRGMAGSHKSKWTWIIKYDPDHFGRHGFDLPKSVKNEYAFVNVGYLDEMADSLVKSKLAKKEGDKVSIDVTKLNYEKVLGSGKISKPLIIKAKSFSKSAIKKIEGSGGDAVTLE